MAADLRVGDRPASLTEEQVWSRLAELWTARGGDRRWGGSFSGSTEPGVGLNHFDMGPSYGTPPKINRPAVRGAFTQVRELLQEALLQEAVKPKPCVYCTGMPPGEEAVWRSAGFICCEERS